MANSEVNIFISYSHKDESLCEALRSHLSPLLREGLIQPWFDRKILPGDDWQNEIDKNINKADIVIALISSSFVESDYCFSNELKIALARHESEETILLPVIVRTCDWKGLPFSNIQALPKDAMPVTRWEDQDEAWLNVVSGIRDAVDRVCLLTQERQGEGQGLSGINELLTREVDRIDERASSSEIYGDISTGIRALDEAIDGIHKGELLIIASRPENGSDRLVRKITGHAAFRQNKRVAYFSMHLPAEKLIRDFLSAEGNLDGSRLLTGRLCEDDWPNFNYAVGLLKDSPLFVDESANLNYSELEERIRYSHKQLDIDLVVIDKLQNLNQTDQSANEGAIKAKGLKNLARELNISILALTGINRAVESRPNKRPVVGDLSLWPEFDDTADVILFTYIGEHYYENQDSLGSIEIIVEKNSSCRVGTLKMRLDDISLEHEQNHTQEL